MKESAKMFGLHIGIVLFVLSISAAVGAVCWTYTLNTWLMFFGKVSSVVWWQGALIGFVPYIGQISIPAAVITFILMLFLG